MALKLNVKPAAKTQAATTPSEASIIATQFRQAAYDLETQEAKVKLLRAQLLEIMAEHRNDRLSKGVADTSVSIPTTDGNKVMVVYPEKYKGLSSDNVPALREAFGENYALFVEEQEDIALKEGLSLKALKDVCGDRFDAVLALFEVKNTVRPRKGAFNNIAELFKKGDGAVAADLVTFVDATIGSPQVRK